MNKIIRNLTCLIRYRLKSSFEVLVLQTSVTRHPRLQLGWGHPSLVNKGNLTSCAKTDIHIIENEKLDIYNLKRKLREMI